MKYFLLTLLIFSQMALSDCRLPLAVDIARGVHAKLKIDFRTDMEKGEYAFFEFSRKFMDQDYGLFANAIVVPFAALVDSFDMALTGTVTGIDNSNMRIKAYQIKKKMEAFGLVSQAYTKKGDEIEKMARKLKWSVTKTARRIKMLNVSYGLCSGKQKGFKEIYKILRR